MRVLALESLGLADQDWGPCVADDFTHEQFAAGWRGAKPCPTEAEITGAMSKAEARAQIATIETLQMQRLTPRADREFRLGVYQALASLPGLGSLATHPAFLALKALDDAIKVERPKL